jgi:hypothetical protein
MWLLSYISITLRLFNSSPWYRWPFLIDGLPINSMVIFHGHVKNNQMVDFDVFSICRDDDNALCMVYLLTKLGDLSKVNIYIYVIIWII